MEKYLNSFKYSGMDPHRKAELKKKIFNAGNNMSLLEKLWLSRNFKIAALSILVLLFLVNIFITGSFEVKEVREYGACSDRECRLEVMKIAEAKGFEAKWFGFNIGG